jgi:hypothetical protein
VVNVTVIQASLSHDRRHLSVTLARLDLERLVRIATRGKPACDDARAGKRCVELQAVAPKEEGARLARSASSTAMASLRLAVASCEG